MREILFRAKTKDNEEWIKGFLFTDGYEYLKSYFITKHIMVPLEDNGTISKTRIIYDPDAFKEIIPKTLCQSIGIKDKYGRAIWENDIIKHEISSTIGVVKWYEEDYVGWCVDDVYVGKQQFTNEMWGECEVIGNIFDALEFLKKAKGD